MATPVVIALSALGWLALYCTFILGHGTVYGLIDMFLLNAEANVPTFFSSSNLLLCSALLFVLGSAAQQSGRPFASAWRALGLAALFVAIDESAQIHELLDRNPEWTTSYFSPEGMLDGPWVVVYGAVVLAFVMAFARFFLHLPGRYKLLFMISAALFVGASIGLEMVGAEILSRDGKTYRYEIVNAIEEICEMVAVVILNTSLLSYLQATYGSTAIQAGRAVA